MKKLTTLLLALLSLPTLAGDMYLNCLKGDLETNEDEFLASSLYDYDAEKAMVSFSQGLDNYTVIYNKGNYTIFKSNSNEGGFTQSNYQIKEDDPLRETPLFDGFSCHIYD